jgi:4-hydroxybenzoate polyprenyltransferase
VTGEVSVRTAWTGAVIALVVFLGAAAALNPLCLVLAPFAVVPLVVYPYAKRFTDFPQVVLGVAQAVAPVGAWVAVTGTFGGPVDVWPAIWLGLAVGTWIGGFDLIYACQDAEVDRTIGVRSVPARFGVARALVASRVVHAVTIALFVAFGVASGASAWWYVGVALTAVALAYEHTLVRADDLSRVGRAFFTVNGFIGIGLFVFGLIGLVAQGLGA